MSLGQDVERASGAKAAPGNPEAANATLEWSQEVLALARRWFLQLRRERLNLIFSVAQPAIWLVFFGTALGRAVDRDVIGTSDYVAFMLPGIIAFTVIGNGMSGAMPLLFDKETGYLDKLMSMPIARSSVIVSRFVYQLALGWMQTVVILLVAAVLGVSPATGLPGVGVVLASAGLLTMAVTAGFLALAYHVPGHGTFFAVAGFVTLPLLFMSSAFVPLEAMPPWMAVVARLNPLTYAIGAMRVLLLDGWTAAVAGDVGVLAAFAAVSLAVGAHQFRRQTGQRAS